MALRVSIWTVSTVLLVLAFGGCAATSPDHPSMVCRHARIATGEPILFCFPYSGPWPQATPPADDEPEKPSA